MRAELKRPFLDATTFYFEAFLIIAVALSFSAMAVIIISQLLVRLTLVLDLLSPNILSKIYLLSLFTDPSAHTRKQK